jgi:hypothetical protein
MGRKKQDEKNPLLGEPAPLQRRGRGGFLKTEDRRPKIDERSEAIPRSGTEEGKGEGVRGRGGEASNK